jgi:poly(glycerol-phosphate) alpha-glucosyltransferase
MLDSWAVRHASLKKQIAGWMFEYRHLKQAACIRALCEAEAKAIRDFGLRNPVAIIPNGIHLPQEACLAHSSSASEVNDECLFGSDGKRTLLYLGRIHPKKGLENVLNGWMVNRSPAQDMRSPKGAVQYRDWRFVIAGWDELSHENALKRCASARRIPWVDLRDEPSMTELSAASVVFAGPQFGESKRRWYEACDAFILPSFSEGLPMVVLEAWSYGKPVLMTPHCNLSEGFSEGAAIRIEPSIESISNGLGILRRHSAQELTEMGQRGRTLVSDRFTWSRVASDLLAVSRWLVDGNSMPECVMLN